MMRAQLVIQGHKETKEILEQRVVLELKDQEDIQVPQVLLVELVHKDLKVIPGLQDLKV